MDRAEALDIDGIQSFKSARLEEGTKNTVNNDLGAVSIVATYAEMKGRIEERPTIKKFDDQTRIRYLEKGEIVAYTATIRRPFRCRGSDS